MQVHKEASLVSRWARSKEDQTTQVEDGWGVIICGWFDAFEGFFLQELVGPQARQRVEPIEVLDG